MELKTKTALKGWLAIVAMASSAAASAATSTGATCSAANTNTDTGDSEGGTGVNASSAAFDSFYCTVRNWTGGSLGKGLAVSMLLLGGAIGVAKNSPMPALSGVAGAAFLSWGPDIIDGIMSSGAGAMLF